MSDNWNFYSLLVDSDPASIFVDLGIGAFAPMPDFPDMAYLRVYMRHPRPDGLSSQEEYEDLVALEKQVSAAVEQDGRTILVGRNTSSGNRDFYFYTRSPSVEDDLRAAMSRWPDYEFDTGTRPDPDWSTYREFLYPSEEDFQRIGNREVVDRLLEHGDRIDAPRRIDHFAYFEARNDRDAFARYLAGRGYNVSNVEQADGRHQVAFDRIDRPADIDDVTIELFRAARQHHGDYDGWGCEAAG